MLRPALTLLVLLSLFPSIGLAELSFPQSYDDARSAFLQAIQGLPGTHEVYKVPSQKFDDLTVDAFYSPAPNAKAVVVLTAGVHGAEGPTGTAMLLEFLKTTARELHQQGVSFALIHALNPYGQRTGRRVTESNIDLNRNFSLDPDLYQTPNPSYEKLNKILNPTGPLKSYFLTTTKATLKLLHALTLRGIGTDEIRNASVGGQYKRPQGIYFGGEKPEPQVVWLEHYFKKNLQDYSDVLLLDIHTGLGDKGVLYLISGPSPSEDETRLMKQVFSDAGEKTYVLTTSDDPGFYPTTGDLTDFVYQVLPDARVVALTAEYGTLGLGILSQLKTLNRLIAENQLAQYGARTPRVRRKVQERFADLFNPEDDEWRTEVARRTRHLYETSLKRYIELVNP